MRKLPRLLGIVLVLGTGCAPSETESAFPRLGEDGYGTTLENPIPMALDVVDPADPSLSSELVTSELDGEVLYDGYTWVPFEDPEGTMALRVDASLGAPSQQAIAGNWGVAAVEIADVVIMTGAVTVVVSVFVHDQTRVDAAVESLRRFATFMKEGAVVEPKVRALTEAEQARAREVTCGGGAAALFTTADLLGIGRGPVRTIGVCDGPQGLWAAPPILTRVGAIGRIVVWNFGTAPVWFDGGSGMAFLNGPRKPLLPGPNELGYVFKGERMLVFTSMDGQRRRPVFVDTGDGIGW